MLFGKIIHLPPNLMEKPTVAGFIRDMQAYASLAVKIEKLMPQSGQHDSVIVSSDDYGLLLLAYAHVLGEAEKKGWKRLHVEEIGNV